MEIVFEINNDNNCIVGYDVAMNTFFFRSGKTDKNGIPILWAGRSFNELLAIDDLEYRLSKMLNVKIRFSEEIKGHLNFAKKESELKNKKELME